MCSGVVFVFWMFVACSLLNRGETVCNGYHDRGINLKVRQLMLDKHNDLRLSVARGEVPNQPKGTNLKRMKWDKYLAYQAQIVADHCEFKHFWVEDERFYVGQNMYVRSSNTSDLKTDWDGAIQSWFDENIDYTYPTFNPASGQYTQIVWADTQYVGCGYIFFNSGDNNRYKKLIVCNYGPGGNNGTQAPYSTEGHGCENLC